MTQDERKISDLAFRCAWLETTARMNITRLQALAKNEAASADDLRKAIQNLADDTLQDLTQLQVKAVEMLLVLQREPADVIPFPGGGKLENA